MTVRNRPKRLRNPLRLYGRAASTSKPVRRAVVAEVLLGLALDEKVSDLVRRSAASALGQLGRAEEKVLDEFLGLARNARTPDYVRLDTYESLKRLLGGATP